MGFLDDLKIKRTFKLIKAAIRLSEKVGEDETENKAFITEMERAYLSGDEAKVFRMMAEWYEKRQVTE